jgi:hypothetical protein
MDCLLVGWDRDGKDDVDFSIRFRVYEDLQFATCLERLMTAVIVFVLRGSTSVGNVPARGKVSTGRALQRPIGYGFSAVISSFPSLFPSGEMVT